MEVAAIDERLDELLNLTRGAFAARRWATIAAERAAEALAVTAAVNDLDGPSPRALRRLAHRAQAATTAARRSAAAADCASRSLADAVAARGDSDFRQADKAVRKATHTAHRALLEAARAGRLGAGLAIDHEPADGPEPAWQAVAKLLRALPLGHGDDDITVPLDRTGRATIGGLVAHAGWQAPAFLVLNLDEERNRYAQVMVGDDDRALVESPSDVFLPEGHRLTAVERRSLERLGFQPPDDEHVNWWQELDFASGDVRNLLLATLRRVHGARAADAVVATIAWAKDHPARAGDDDDPAILDLDEPTVEAAAAGIAERLESWSDVLAPGDAVLTVTQDGWDAVATVSFDTAGRLITALTTDDERPARLSALGWAQDEDSYTTVFPRGTDTQDAVWHLTLYAVAVLGLDLRQPVRASIDLAETQRG